MIYKEYFKQDDAWKIIPKSVKSETQHYEKPHQQYQACKKRRPLKTAHFHKYLISGIMT